MFGGGKFDDTFGELTFFHTLFTNSGSTPEEHRKKQIEISKKQEEQRKKVTNNLVVKLEPFATGAIEDFENQMAITIAYKSEAPGGAALLKLVGEIYVEVAKQYIGGIQGFFSSIVEKSSFATHFFTAISSTVKLHSANQSAFAQDPDIKAQSVYDSVDAIWSLGKIEISRLLHDVCKTVLGESGIPAPMLQARALGLHKLGQMYIEAGTQGLYLRNKSTEYDIPETLSAKMK